MAIGHPGCAAQHLHQRLLDVGAEVARIDADGQLDLQGNMLGRFELDILAGKAVAVDVLLQVSVLRSAGGRLPPPCGSAARKTVYQLPVQRMLATASSIWVLRSAMVT